jgi:hypothetical protein
MRVPVKTAISVGMGALYPEDGKNERKEGGEEASRNLRILRGRLRPFTRSRFSNQNKAQARQAIFYNSLTRKRIPRRMRFMGLALKINSDVKTSLPF